MLSTGLNGFVKVSNGLFQLFLVQCNQPQVVVSFRIVFKAIDEQAKKNLRTAVITLLIKNWPPLLRYRAVPWALEA